MDEWKYRDWMSHFPVMGSSTSCRMEYIEPYLFLLYNVWKGVVCGIKRFHILSCLIISTLDRAREGVIERALEINSLQTALFQHLLSLSTASSYTTYPATLHLPI